MFDTIDVREKTYLLVPAGKSPDVRNICDRIANGQATAEPIQVFALKYVPAEGAPDECEELAKLEYHFLYRNIKGGAYNPHINVEPGRMDARLKGLLSYAPFHSIDGLLIDNGQAVLLDKKAAEELVIKYFFNKSAANIASL